MKLTHMSAIAIAVALLAGEATLTLASQTVLPLLAAKAKGGMSLSVSSSGSGEGSTAAAAATPEPTKAARPIGGAGKFAPAAAAWQATTVQLGFQPLQNVRVLSPLCPSGQEATACAAFSGNTAVVLSSVFPAIGTSTGIKTTQCFCDLRNSITSYLPPSPAELYRCAAYCQ